jgi:hypothetical protein
MSVKRYLEVDSSYRNRNEYPLPSQFVVNISQTGEKKKEAALDPVSDAAPILAWNNNFIQDTPGTSPLNSFTTGANITVSPVTTPSLTGDTIFKITSPIELRQTRDFYVGCNLSRYENGVIFPPTTPLLERRIIAYLPLDLNNAIITLEQSLPDTVIGLGNFFIKNPSSIGLANFVLFDLTSTWFSGTSTYRVSAFYPRLNLTPNYYAGWTFGIGSNKAFPPIEPISQTIVISSSNPVGLVVDLVVANGIGNAFFSPGFYLIPPNFNPNTLQGVLTFWIPVSNDNYEETQRTSYFGVGGDNYYVNLGVQNMNDLSFARITSFNSVTRLATLQSPPTKPDGSWTYKWEATTSNYVMRKQQPIFSILQSVAISKEWGTSVFLNLQPGQGTTYGLYSGKFDYDFLRLKKNFFTPPYTRPTNEEKQIKRYVYGEGNILSISPLQIVLGGGSDIDDFYKDCIVRTYRSVGSFFPLVGTQKIKSYNGSTKVATFYSPITVWPPMFPPVETIWIINTCILTNPFTITSSSDLTDITYEIEQYSYDNARPFNYTGSLVSDTESVCCEIDLLFLIQP